MDDSKNAVCGCRDSVDGGVVSKDTSRSRFAYVIGTVSAVFPDVSIQEEANTVARTLGLANGLQDFDRPSGLAWMHDVLKHARYVARQVSWILAIEGIPAYTLRVQDWSDLPDLVECLRRDHAADDLELVVGEVGPMVAVRPGLQLPSLLVDQVCSFRRSQLTEQLKGGTGPAQRKKAKAAEGAADADRHFDQLFDRLVQIADNIGTGDDARALNFLAVRYQPIYQLASDMQHQGISLTDVTVRASRLSGGRRIVDPVFAFVNGSGQVKKYFVRVDVTDKFPMIATHLQEYFDR